MDKNTQIANTMRETYEKRRHQICRVFELKINKNRLNKIQEETLKMMFIESKWCYNYIIGLMENENFNIFSFQGKELIDITHKDKDMNNISVHISYLTSSLKDSLVSKIQSQVKTLSTLKKKGKNIGGLKFKSEYNSIVLKQLGVTHKIISKNKIKIQGIKKPLPINGLKQLDKYDYYEIANAILHKCGNDYYIYLTVYFNKETEGKIYKNKRIGIDFGCQTSLTLSNGQKINALIEEGERLKRLQRKMFKQKKGSNNRCKTIAKIQKQYRRNSNIKNDLANKIVHQILTENEQIIIQDEQLKSWSARHGKKIQHGILGRVKTKLKEHPNRVFVLNKFIPTTKLCFDCGHVHREIKLSDREFICPNCGSYYDRDVHAAMNMVWIYENFINKIGLGESNFKRADFDEEVHRFFYEWNSQRMKLEDATPLE